MLKLSDEYLYKAFTQDNFSLFPLFFFGGFAFFFSPFVLSSVLVIKKTREGERGTESIFYFSFYLYN